MNQDETVRPEDFIKAESEFDTTDTTDAVDTAEPDELDIQRTVVEALAAEKAELSEQFAALKKKNEELKSEKQALDNQKNVLRAEKEELRSALARMSELLIKNSERAESSQIALIDRNVEIDDRFPGETRDHVLEILREARDNAEKEGRRRRAQLLEAVLVANEPVGELKSRREKLEKLFEENNHIINGTVIADLEKSGISHKDGENYLLAAEILKRNY